MFCPNCGANVPDESKFCPKCGTGVDPAEETNARPGNTNEPAGGAGETGGKRMSSRTIGIIIAAVVVVALVVILIAALGSSGNTIDLDQYVSISFTGSDGYGKATCEIDRDAIIEQYTGKLSWKNESSAETFSQKLLYSDPVDALVSQLKGSLDVTSGLSNGDTVTFTWKIDAEEIESSMNVKLKYGDIVETVSDLEEIQTFDAFADVSVEFAGTSPEAVALLSVNGGHFGESAYMLDKNTDLAAGETVTVAISEAAADALLESEGIYPAEMSREYTVEGVSHYAVSVDQIPEDAMDRMKSESEDVFRAHVARDWDAEVQELKSMEFLGTYFLSRKEGIEEGHVNEIDLIYRVNSTLYDKDEDGNRTGHDLDYYIYVAFFDGIVMDDGTFSINYTDYDYPWDKSYDDTIAFEVTYYDYTQDWTINQEQTMAIGGSLNLDDMFSYLVTTQVDNYTYENTVTENQPEPEEQSETEDLPEDEG